jgi:antitoxin (DNA-binding transcriptional repressor) of toxin-antitoxin stability system
MKTVDIDDAGTQLSALVEDALAGEEVVLAKGGKPVARLVAVREKGDILSTLGMLKGQIWVSDDFDDPLPPDILRGFGIEE